LKGLFPVREAVPPCADVDADGKPTRQVAEVSFECDESKKEWLTVRVIAVRRKERDLKLARHRSKSTWSRGLT
jgi:hypothetical protein